ncbi:MAG: hypothetical protein E7310_06335 [Clostridiales bacterium]|nr:hypothetical protein [Clostridiales bacterium]
MNKDKIAKNISKDIEEILGELMIDVLIDEYSKGRKSIEELWTKAIKESEFRRVVKEKKEYKEVIGTLCGGMEIAMKLLHAKKLKDDPKGRLFLIRKLEDNLQLLREYTEEVM